MSDIQFCQIFVLLTVLAAAHSKLVTMLSKYHLMKIYVHDHLFQYFIRCLRDILDCDPSTPNSLQICLSFSPTDSGKHKLIGTFGKNIQLP